MTPPMESTATQTIATIAFGVTATLISVFTVWQGRRAWRKLYRQGGERNAESDLESQTSIELEAGPARSNIFELPATPFPETPLLGMAASALPEEARLLDPPAASAPSTAPTTTTFAPV